MTESPKYPPQREHREGDHCRDLQPDFMFLFMVWNTEVILKKLVKWLHWSGITGTKKTSTDECLQEEHYAFKKVNTDK